MPDNQVILSILLFIIAAKYAKNLRKYEINVDIWLEKNVAFFWDFGNLRSHLHVLCYLIFNFIFFFSYIWFRHSSYSKNVQLLYELAPISPSFQSLDHWQSGKGFHCTKMFLNNVDMASRGIANKANCISWGLKAPQFSRLKTAVNELIPFSPFCPHSYVTTCPKHLEVTSYMFSTLEAAR